MGSESSSNTTSNTNNISNNNQVYNVGLTGADAANAIGRISQGLDSVTARATAVQQRAFDFQRSIINQGGQSLNSLIAAAQDVSARSIAAGSGQATPIVETTEGKGTGKPGTLLVLAGLAVAVFAFSK